MSSSPLIQCISFIESLDRSLVTSFCYLNVYCVRHVHVLYCSSCRHQPTPKYHHSDLRSTPEAPPCTAFLGPHRTGLIGQCVLAIPLFPFIYTTRSKYPLLSHNDANTKRIEQIRHKTMASSSGAATQSPQSPQSPPPDPTLVLFARGVIARLEVWPALRVAVEQGWGGPSSREKRRWLASEIVDAFDSFSSTDEDTHARAYAKDSARPDAEYVALMLAQALEDEFDASIEDGSVEGVAADVVGLWGAGEDVVGEWERRAEGVRGKKVEVHVQEAVGDDDDDEWEDEESGEENEEDADADVAPQLMQAAARDEVQRVAKPNPIVDEDGFTLVQKGRR
jgi:pre-rRNA-processing protein TSR2